MADSEAVQLRCVACKASMPAGAKLCSECGTHQDWRRHLSFGSSVIALLIALISVSTLFIDSVPLRWFGGASVQTALIGTTVIKNGEPIVQVAIENLGFRSAIIGSAAIELTSNRIGTLEIGLNNSKPLLLERGGHLVWNYYFNDLQNDYCKSIPVPILPRFHLGKQVDEPELKRQLEEFVCTLRVTSTETGGGTDTFNGIIDCKMLIAVAEVCLDQGVK